MSFKRLCALAVLIGGVTALPLFAQEETVHDAREAALNAYDIQRDLPGVETGAEEGSAPQDYSPRGNKNQPVSLSSLQKVVDALAIVVKWVVIIGGGFLLIILFVKAAQNWDGVKAFFIRGKKVVPPPPVSSPMRADTARDFLAEADALAAQGRFGEAVHCLLFRTFEDLVERAKLNIPKSQTMREVLHAVDLSKAARGPLQTIISLVEVSYFGKAKLEEEAYHKSRQSYHQFLTALDGGTA